MGDMDYLVFFETWYYLAEGRDTDEKRLAFYDTIMRYAFEGVEPEKPVRGESSGSAWAAWDAFVVAKDKIDKHKAKVAAGKSGGRGGNESSKARFGNQNASKTQADEKQNASRTQANEGININKNRNKNKRDISGGKPPSPSLSKKDVESFFDQFWKAYPSSCPRKFDKKKCLAKWELIFRDAKDKRALFDAIMDGLGKWKRSQMWHDEEGKYIRAPLVWLNGECWDDAPSPSEDNASAIDETKQRKIAAIAEGLRKEGLM